uniref:Uncharacterized protein n=1 Tax=uncultured bacterium 5G4 TaxID=1701326 RepID=A0A166H2R2_9BACT|nr:hypothetical protein 5G4_009 [uncultured bacterium 5G4]
MKTFQVQDSHPTHGSIRLDERQRFIGFLPHPNARVPRTFETWPKKALEAARTFLTEQMGEMP